MSDDTRLNERREWPGEQRSRTKSYAITASLEQPNASRDGISVARSSQTLREEFDFGQLTSTLRRENSTWTRILEATIAFPRQAKDLVCSERINVLLVFVPVGIAIQFSDQDPIVVFILNALAIIPLAVVISTATEVLASRLGDTLGALLNVTIGNAAELIIFFTALAKDQIRIVQSSLLGSVLANSLLVLGTANLFGGLRFKHKLHDRVAGRMSIALLDVGLVISMFPVIIFASTHEATAKNDMAGVLSLSRGISVGLMIVYVLYLSLQMRLQTKGPTPNEDSRRVDGRTYVALRDPHSVPPEDVTHTHLGHSRHSDTLSAPRFRSLSLALPPFGTSSNGLSKWVSRFVGENPRKRATKTEDFRGSTQDTGPPITHEARTNGQPSNRRKSNTFELTSYPRSSTADDVLGNNQGGHQLKAEMRSSPLPPSPPTTPDSDSDILPDSSDTNYSLPEPLHPIVQSPDALERLSRSDTSSNSSDQTDSPAEGHGEERLQTSFWVAVLVLLFSTGIAAACTELAVDTIPAIVDSWRISHIFLGFIVLPFVGNAAEHVTAAKMALRNRMVLAKSVAVESATQVVMFITPAIVLFSWLRSRTVSLRFDSFEIGCVAAAGIVVSAVICYGKSGYKQGILLHLIYVVFAIGAVFYRGAESEKISA